MTIRSLIVVVAASGTALAAAALPAAAATPLPKSAAAALPPSRATGLPTPAPAPARIAAAVLQPDTNQVRQFWTPARMLAAVQSAQEPSGSSFAWSFQPMVQATLARTPWWLLSARTSLPRPDAGTRTIGKIFETTPGISGYYQCSGALVQSANGSTIWTAGHCVHWGGKWYTNVVFVPDYQPTTTGNPAPYGVWPATFLATTADWQRQGSDGHWGQDFGAMTVARDQRGRTLAQVLGAAQRVAFGVNPSRLTVFGYPALPPYNGQQLWQCGPRRVGRPIVTSEGPGPRPVGIACGMTKGSSGGPWIVHPTRRGIGVVVTVTSSADAHNHMFGAFQTQSAAGLYRLVSHRTV